MNNDIKKIDKNMNDSKLESLETKWYNSLSDNFIIHGLYWLKQNNNFHRVNDKIFVSNSVTTLSTHPSGAYLSFKTNSRNISVKVNISSNAYMSHMSACGQCGLDLYCLIKNKYVFVGTTKINQANYSLTILKNIPKKERIYRLYLPLYITLNSLEIGIDGDCTIDPYEEYKKECIVCYGTSITQGGCATRPGMNFSSIMGRNLPFEVYNLGFSGSCHLEEAMAIDIAKMKNVRYLIIEAEANAGDCSNLEDNLENFLNITSKTIQDIYLLSRYPAPLALLNKDFKNHLKHNYDFQKNICNKYNNVHFIDGNKLLKNLDYEETVDTVHLTDLGFLHVAKYFIKIFRKK